MSLNCDMEDSESLLILISYTWDLSSQLYLTAENTHDVDTEGWLPKGKFQILISPPVYLFFGSWMDTSCQALIQALIKSG